MRLTLITLCLLALCIFVQAQTCRNLCGRSFKVARIGPGSGSQWMDNMVRTMGGTVNYVTCAQFNTLTGAQLAASYDILQTFWDGDETCVWTQAKIQQFYQSGGKGIYWEQENLLAPLADSFGTFTQSDGNGPYTLITSRSMFVELLPPNPSYANHHFLNFSPTGIYSSLMEVHSTVSSTGAPANFLFDGIESTVGCSHSGRAFFGGADHDYHATGLYDYLFYSGWNDNSRAAYSGMLYLLGCDEIIRPGELCCPVARAPPSSPVEVCVIMGVEPLLFFDWGDGAITSVLGVIPGSEICATHTYGSSGPKTIEVSDLLKTVIVSVSVPNVAPVITSAGGSAQAYVPFTMPNWSFTDLPDERFNVYFTPDLASVGYTLIGSNRSPGTITFPSVTYTSPGTYSFCVRIEDTCLCSSSTACETVTVSSAPPPTFTLTFPSPNQLEGNVLSMSNSFSDVTPGPWTCTYNWGDTTSTSYSTSMKTCSANHVYADNGSYTIQLCISNPGTTDCQSSSYSILNVNPVLSLGPSISGSEGSSVTFSGSTFNDKGTLDTHTATVNWGDGTAPQSMSITETPYGPPGSTSGVSGSIAAMNHVYTQDGTYTISVTLRDDDGGAVTGTRTATIGNVAPTLNPISDTGGPGGSPITVSGSINDNPNSVDTHTVVIDWGDGTTTTVNMGPGQENFSATHIYADDGVYNVDVTVTDTSGGTATDSLLISVSNVDPVVTGINSSPPSGIQEGDPVTFSATFEDVETLDTHTAIIYYGDGTSATGVVTETPTGPPGSSTPTRGSVTFPSHIYGDEGTYTVRICVTDDEGGEGCSTTSYSTVNAPPTMTATVSAANEGVAVSINHSFNDKGSMDTHTITVDFGDGTGTTSATVNETPSGPPGSASGVSGTGFASHIYADNGSYTIRSCISDGDGATVCINNNVVVGNQPPEILSHTNDFVGFEGFEATVEVTVRDMGTLDTHTIQIDWDDGTSTTRAATQTPFGPPGSNSGQVFTNSFTHVYADNAVHTVTILVTDDEGATDSSSLVITVENEVPQMHEYPVVVRDENTGEVTVSAFTFKDLGTLDTHTVELFWGDGTSTPLTVTQTPFGPPGSTDGQIGRAEGASKVLPYGYSTLFIRITDDNGGEEDFPLFVVPEIMYMYVPFRIQWYVEQGESPSSTSSCVATDSTGGTISCGDGFATILGEIEWGPHKLWPGDVNFRLEEDGTGDVLADFTIELRTGPWDV